MLPYFPRDVLGEILNLVESVSEGFPTYSFKQNIMKNVSGFTTNNTLNKYFCRFCSIQQLTWTYAPVRIFAV